jgi:glutathione synthase/RimK-type ligase-like ATP-grasp enzyme
MVDVVLAVAKEFLHGPDPETALLVAALQDRGITSAMEPWGSEASRQGGLVVIRSTWDYPDVRAEFLGWAREVSTVTRLFNPIDVIEWNSHKSYLLDLAYAAVPVIPTALVMRDASDAEQLGALQEYEGEVVIKPAVGVGAAGLMRTGALSPEAADHLRLLIRTGDALVQPFEPTVVDGEISLIYFGGELSHSVRKVPASGDYRVHTFHGGTVEWHVATIEEQEVAAVALAAVTSDLAYARVDLLATARGPAVMELELIEPQLFLDEDDAASARFADHLVTLLGAS